MCEPAFGGVCRLLIVPRTAVITRTLEGALHTRVVNPGAWYAVVVRIFQQPGVSPTTDKPALLSGSTSRVSKPGFHFSPARLGLVETTTDY